MVKRPHIHSPPFHNKMYEQRVSLALQYEYLPQHSEFAQKYGVGWCHM